MKVRNHILDMPPYEPVVPYEILSENLGIAVDKLVKLDANENPYGPLPQVLEALGQLPYAHIYPDPQSRILRKALADHIGLPADLVLAGAGADELIDLVMRACLDPGESILNCPPTFGMYAFDGDVNDVDTINVFRKPDFSIDVPAIESLFEREPAERHPRILFLASPNNPDGSLVARDDIMRLLDLPVLLVLDEAYIEFAPPGFSWINEVSKRENLVVLRTFSKWAGLAGLRVGYGAFPGWLIEQLWKVKQPYNVSVAASTAAIVSLEYKDEIEQRRKWIINERERLYSKLIAFPWLKPYPSQANFILCQVMPVAGLSITAKDLKKELSKEGILVRYFQKPGLEDHIRFSIGKPEHTDSLLTALEGII